MGLTKHDAISYQIRLVNRVLKRDKHKVEEFKDPIVSIVKLNAQILVTLLYIVMNLLNKVVVISLSICLQ